MTVDDSFRIGSITKTFTATAVLPKQCALGISPSRLMSAAKWNLWVPDDVGGRPTGKDRCH